MTRCEEPQISVISLYSGFEDAIHALLVSCIYHRALLTHIGKYQARARAEAIQQRAGGSYDWANGGAGWSESAAKADRDAISQVIFTDPQIASVGLTEQDAKDLKLNVRAVDHDISTLEGAKLHTDGYSGHIRILALAVTMRYQPSTQTECGLLLPVQYSKIIHHMLSADHRKSSDVTIIS